MNINKYLGDIFNISKKLDKYGTKMLSGINFIYFVGMVIHQYRTKTMVNYFPIFFLLRSFGMVFPYEKHWPHIVWNFSYVFCGVLFSNSVRERLYYILFYTACMCLQLFANMDKIVARSLFFPVFIQSFITNGLYCFHRYEILLLFFVLFVHGVMMVVLGHFSEKSTALVIWSDVILVDTFIIYPMYIMSLEKKWIA